MMIGAAIGIIIGLVIVAVAVMSQLGGFGATMEAVTTSGRVRLTRRHLELDARRLRDERVRRVWRCHLPAHRLQSQLLLLLGEDLTHYRVWDGMRALDYLLSRREVDARRVACTGNSGGGTMTTWLCGLDDRWTMAAPSCFVTELRRNMENELGADMEQIPPRALVAMYASALFNLTPAQAETARALLLISGLQVAAGVVGQPAGTLNGGGSYPPHGFFL